MGLLGAPASRHGELGCPAVDSAGRSVGRVGVIAPALNLDIDDPVVRPAGTGKDARVSSRPIEGGVSVSGFRGTDACENRKDQQRKNRTAPCENAPKAGPRIRFHIGRLSVSVVRRNSLIANQAGPFVEMNDLAA